MFLVLSIKMFCSNVIYYKEKHDASVVITILNEMGLVFCMFVRVLT